MSRPRGQYDLAAMAQAYSDCLQPGTHSVARVARQYRVPRKTLENYVTGRTSIQALYRKLEGCVGLLAYRSLTATHGRPMLAYRPIHPTHEKKNPETIIL